MSDDNFPVPASDNLPATNAGVSPPEVTPVYSPKDDGWTQVGQAKPAQLSQGDRETYQALTNHMQQALKSAVPQHVISGTSQWLRYAFSQPSLRERPQHYYRVNVQGIAKEDGPYVTSFLNFAARSHFTEKQTQAVIDWYKGLVSHSNQKQQQAREFDPEATDNRDIVKAELALKNEWGSMYYQNLEVVKKYVRNLPLEEREALHERRANGTVKLNDPATLRHLFIRARDGRGDGLQKEIAALESRMRTDRKAWIKDEAAQARLRELYRQRDGG
jgi:hypothetical protein